MQAQKFKSHWLLCIALQLLATTATAADVETATWKLQREDLKEYSLFMTLPAKGRALQRFCNLQAAKDAHAVSYDEASDTCSLFVCRLGGSGCGKCRNADNLSLPLLWVKQQTMSCWKTFQHRVDGSLSFNRTWSDYVSGFGQTQSLNYWMGLEQLHQLTKDGVWRVRWEFSDWNGTWYWAENLNFSVADASDKYRARLGPLDSSKSSVGQRTDPLWSVNNQKFSTIDSQNDMNPTDSCAQITSSGWWFGWCTAISANGVYQVPPLSFTGGGIYYYLQEAGTGGNLNPFYSMKTFEILIRQ